MIQEGATVDLLGGSDGRTRFKATLPAAGKDPLQYSASLKGCQVESNVNLEGKTDGKMMQNFFIYPAPIDFK